MSCKRPEVVYDFAANLAAASLTTETRRIDFGDAGSRPLLLDGWSEDELWRQPDNTIIWGTGPSSSLIIFHFGMDGLELRYRCMPTWLDPRKRQQTVTFVVNGHRLAPTVLHRELEIYRQSVPAAFLRRGANAIRIEYAFWTPPRFDDDRPITVAWDWMECSHPPRPAARRAENATVLMPPRTQLSFLAPVRRGCSLKLDEVDAGTNGHLHVLIGDVAGDSTGATAGRQMLAAGEAIDIPLPATRPALTEIAFVQTQLRRSGSTQWAKLVRPRIECASASDSAERLPSAAPSPRPNVLIYLVDTLRADHLGIYGYRRPTSMNIDAFARDSVVFTRAIAQSGWTKTSVASILTGLVPFHHGTLDVNDALPPSLPTLPAMLGAAGYSRFAAVANGSVGPQFGFDRGFERFVSLGGSAEDVGERAEVVVRAFQAWLDKRPAGAPFFAYVHTIDPHDPYAAPQPYAREFSSRLKTALATPFQATIDAVLKARPELSVEDVRADLTARYDAEIVYNDAVFGRAIADLKRRGLYDSTLIIFTSDHGEEFLDHGHWGHGHSLNHELLHVPLLVKFPGNRNAGTVVGVNVQHVDLVPTILEAAGAGGAGKLDGMPLMDVPAAAERSIVSYLRLNEFDIMSAVYGESQYILRNAPDPLQEQLVRFGPSSSDPELDRMYSQPWRQELRKTVVRFHQQARKIQTPQVPLEGDLARKLRALGYLR